MKRFLSALLLLPFFSTFTADESRLALFVPQENIVSHNMEAPRGLLYGSEGFSVVNENTVTPVHNYDVTPELRQMDIDKAAKVLSATRLKVTQLSNGEYTIARHGELKGGGPLGAAIGWHIGWWGTWAVQQTVAATAGTIVGTVTANPLAGAATYKTITAGSAHITLVTAQAMGTALAITGGAAPSV